MKHFCQTTRQTQQMFAALVLTSLLSLGVGTTLIKTAAAQPARSSQDVTKPSAERQLPPEVINAVRREITRNTNIPPGQLRVVTFTRESWPNSCLGLSKPNQACGQVFIPNGWRVVMSNGRQNWVYRTDGIAYIVRLEGQQNPPNLPDSNELPSLVAKTVLRAASERTGLQTSDLRIVKSEKITTDGCLGLGRPEESCLAIAQEAWEVTVAAGKELLVYRANRMASQVRLKEGETDNGEAKLPQSIANAVLRVASEQLGVPSFRLKITKAEKKRWTDSCLGLPSPVERCMGRLTPGWRVVVEGRGQSQVYRTDDSGFQVRAENVAVERPGDDKLPNSVAKAVLRDASSRSNLSLGELRIVKAEQREWPNGCLGLVERGRFCTQAIVPGWHVTVKGGQQTFVYRTDDSGSLVKFEDAAGQENGEAVPIPKSELPPSLNENAIFRVISSGGFAGQTFETTLLNNGRMIRRAITRIGTDSTPQLIYISPEKLRQFKQILAKQSLSQFNGLSYPPPKGAADYITVTLSSQDGTTRYADMNQDRLPKALQEVIQAWNQIARNR